jgi:hypothetical protein
MGAQMAENNGMAIGRGTLGADGGSGPAAANDIFHPDRLPQGAGHVAGNQVRDDIRRSARRERHDDGDRAHGEIRSRGGASRTGVHQYARNSNTNKISENLHISQTAQNCCNPSRRLRRHLSPKYSHCNTPMQVYTLLTSELTNDAARVFSACDLNMI